MSVEGARAALQRGDWEGAVALAQEAVDRDGSAEAFDVLGHACWWTSDVERLFASRERAFRLYLAAGEVRRAARVAAWLDWDFRSFRGQPVVARGWLRRARRLLAGHEDSAEYGWLRQREAEDMLGENSVEAIAAAIEASALGRRHGDADLEFLALSSEGLARVTAGQVSEGMQALDEATVAVVSGEFSDQSAAGVTCCHMISACELVRDFERAEQWCMRVREFCDRLNFRPLYAVCRTQYAGVLVSSGRWEDAESELAAAATELASMRPGFASMAHLHLADLRRRQGRLDEATTHLRPFETSPQAWLGFAAIALDRGEAGEAELHARRFLRRVARGNHTARATALELIVLAAAASGRLSAVRREATELRTLAADVDSDAIRASAALVDGVLAAADGDPIDAADLLEEAAALFESTGMPYDALRARLQLVEALSAGDEDARVRAQAEARNARQEADRLGATRLASRAEALLSRVPMSRAAESPTADRREDTVTVTSLTDRERQVLAHVAKGRSNRQIAERLGVSQHTVHRHLANVLNKTGASTRAAAVAFALQHGIGMEA